jgi:predicted PurR-regulated permease PerM
MVLLYLLFIMLDYEKLLVSFRKLVPPRYRQFTFRLVKDVQDSMNHYFRGQALVALCVGILFAIGFSIIGLPMGVVLGLFIGVLNMVPYLQLISLLPTTLLCIVCSVDGNITFWTIWLECMAVYAIVQAIQDFILTPKIMGKYLGLNPAIILLSLSVWGSLLGLVGMIIALPLTTLLIAYYNRYVTSN